MRLSNEQGYFCKRVTLPDPEGGEAVFSIRELDDETLGVCMGKLGEVKEKLGLKDLPDGPLDRDMVKALADMTGLKMTEGELLSVVTLNKAAVDAACAAGIVAWELGRRDEDPPCTPENRVLLPAEIKYRLSQQILAVSTLSFDEQGFTSGSPMP